MSIKHVIELERLSPYYPNADLKESEAIWGQFREDNGFKNNGKTTLLKTTGNWKTEGTSATLSLSAGAKAEYGMCVNSATCETICVVNKSIRGQMSYVIKARNTITKFLIEHPTHFAAILKRDIDRYKGQYIRLNTNSDVAWEKLFPWIEDTDKSYYDYTKRRDRVGYVLPNYRITYSATNKTSIKTIHSILKNNGTVTAVMPVKKGELPELWNGLTVVNGDESDNRFIDPGGVIVGLSAKGKLKKFKEHPLLVGME